LDLRVIEHADSRPEIGTRDLSRDLCAPDTNFLFGVLHPSISDKSRDPVSVLSIVLDGLHAGGLMEAPRLREAVGICEKLHFGTFCYISYHNSVHIDSIALVQVALDVSCQDASNGGLCSG
jgi:hypothetical protein